MPHVDWQFIIVTLIALSAFAVLVWKLMPARGSKDIGKPTACANCASAESTAHAPKPTRTVTTPVVSLSDLRSTARQVKH
jgi:hypothetical protein